MLRPFVVISCISLSITAWSAGAGSASPVSPELDAQQHTTWQSIGPAPPAITTPIVADAATHTIYIGSAGGGVLRSTNGGATFVAVNNGLGGSIITGLAIAPNSSNVVYANTQFDGFYKTIDGGAHWTGGNWGGFTLLADPANPGTLYSASGPFDYVQKSTDGGNTWSYAADGLGEASVSALAMDPHNSKVLYAGGSGQALFKSTDGAATWTPITINTNITALLVDPDNSKVIYAGTDGHGVYKSTNDGRLFARVGSPKVTRILALAKSGQTLYAGTATQGVSESVDGGRTWRNSGVSSGIGNVLSVDSAGSVYAGTNFDGAFVRSVSDSDWRRIGWNELKRCKCQNGNALAIDPADHNHLIFTTNGGGLLVTEDGGRSWSDGGTEGLTSDAPRGVAFDPQEPRRVYAGSLEGGSLYKSEDHGKHWQRRRLGPPDAFVFGVAVDQVDHSVYATTGNGHGLWKSTDYGDTFTRIDRAPGAPEGVFLGLSGHTVTIDPNNHAIIYLPDDGAVMGIWRSQDAGRSWKEVDATDNFESVTVDPTDSSIVYASSQNFSGGPAVLKSLDGGHSFSPLGNGLPSGFGGLNTGFLLVNPKDPRVLYTGFEYVGVFKSTNAGESWFPINLGLDNLYITGLAMDPESPATVYAATWFRSVYKTVTGGR
jgi:photosystem II stability/assembly factor-like uncharacterized protein